MPGGVLDTTALCSLLVPFPAPLPIATDACSGLTATPTSTGKTNTPGPCLDQYTITVHRTASDVCGNKTNFDQFVHVIDTVAPTLVNIPPNITVECNAIPVPPKTPILSMRTQLQQSSDRCACRKRDQKPRPDYLRTLDRLHCAARMDCHR